MAKPGPAPKPVELKLVEGNLGRRPLPEVPKPTIAASAPKPPAVLGTEGKRLWNRIAPELHRLGLLTDLDLEALVALCVTWEQARAAAELIRKQGIVDLPVFRKDGEVSGYRTQRHPAPQELRGDRLHLRRGPERLRPADARGRGMGAERGHLPVDPAGRLTRH